jgi:hypothetical protein
MAGRGGARPASSSGHPLQHPWPVEVHDLGETMIASAHTLKLGRDVRTVEPGKRADLVVPDGTPLEAIGNVRTARCVVSNERLYDCKALWQASGLAPP